MNKLLTIFLLITFKFNFSIGQGKLVFISKYQTGFDKETLQQSFRISGQNFAFDRDGYFYLNDQILDSVSKDSTFHMEVYKERYLFVSFYLIKPVMPPTAAEVAEKLHVKIYDLRNPGKKWTFYFAGYNSLAFRWFRPKKSKVKFVRKDILRPTGS